MSHWTNIIGSIIVSPMGDTQAQMRYILDTVLAHLPLVTGSEKNMFTHVIERSGTNEWVSHDEFAQYSQQAQERYSHDGIRMQSEYIIVVEGDLRDRRRKETIREFINWLCRLAKRIHVEAVSVMITADYNEPPCIITDDGTVFLKMYELPSWCRRDKSHPDITYNWCEYLRYDNAAKNSRYPLWLAEKYGYENEERTIEEETERRRMFRGW